MHSGDFFRYTSAVAISNLGTYSSGIAYPLLALSLGAGTEQVGLLVTCALLARMICRMPAGQLSDRLDRRWLMLTADLVRMVALASVPAAAALGRASFLQLLLVAVTEGVFGAIFSPAASAAVRDVLADKADLTQAISRIQATNSTLALIGPALGGWLFSVHQSLPFAVDAASYAVSAALLLRLKTLPPPRLPAAQRDLRWSAGWRWLGTQSDLLTVVLFGALLNFVSGAGYITLLLALRERDVSSTAIGVLMACGSAGSLLGALLAPRLIRALSITGVLLVVGSLWTAGMAVYAVAPPVVLVAAVFSLLMIISPASGILMAKLTLTDVPRDLLGRVRGATDTVVYGLAILAPVLAGVAIDRLGLPTTWSLLAAVAGAATVVVGPGWYRRRSKLAVVSASAAGPGLAASTAGVVPAVAVEN